ncbi:MAG TPA: hypothetical protein VLT15_07505, partial [Acidimicrobiia bacterium]|nr:hypothetical protein [Acidimicrobiia bacterium]
MTDGEASGRGGRRPGWAGLIWATVVVLVVGGFALSRSYGVPEVSSGTLPPVPPLPSTSTTTAPSVADTTPLESVDAVYDDWVYVFQDLAVDPYGVAVYGVAADGVAIGWLDGDWELLDVDALPTGTGLDDGLPGRVINQVATGPSTGGDVWSGVWFSGYSRSDADDEEFGGTLDGWTGGRMLGWVARYHCPVCGQWTVWTSNEVPEFANGIGDLAVSPDGMVYASVGEDLLMMFDGEGWNSHQVPLPPRGSGVSYPWSSSLTVGIDGVVWAGTNYSNGGVLRFDGTDFTRYTVEDGLPSGQVVRVSSAGDGTIWAATERSGVASFDGTTWTSYATADGLLSDQAVIAAGADGTVWAVHYERPPYGYSRFDGTEWTSYRFDQPVGGYRAEVIPDGTLWTISDEGLVSFDGTTRIIHASPFVQPEGSLTFTPVQWRINLDDPGPGVHTVFMEVDARPLTASLVDGLSGKLIWDETVVDLCRIGIRNLEDGFLHIGDIFQTSEGC